MVSRITPVKAPPSLSCSRDNCLILHDPSLEAWSESGIFPNLSIITPSGCLRGMGRKRRVLHLNPVWGHPLDSARRPTMP